MRSFLCCQSKAKLRTHLSQHQGGRERTQEEHRHNRGWGNEVLHCSFCLLWVGPGWAVCYRREMLLFLWVTQILIFTNTQCYSPCCQVHTAADVFHLQRSKTDLSVWKTPGDLLNCNISDVFTPTLWISTWLSCSLLFRLPSSFLRVSISLLPRW